MAVLERVMVARPKEKIWRVLADFGGISCWALDVDHSRLLTSQTEGVGASRRVQIGRLAFIERVVEWQPGARLSYAIEGIPLVRGAVNAWTLESTGDATNVSLASRIDGNPASRFLMGRVLAPSLKKLLDDLKSYVEQRV